MADGRAGGRARGALTVLAWQMHSPRGYNRINGAGKTWSAIFSTKFMFYFFCFFVCFIPVMIFDWYHEMVSCGGPPC